MTGVQTCALPILYLGRSHFLWKEPATMSWLEENVHEVLQAVDAGDPAVEACESR